MEDEEPDLRTEVLKPDLENLESGLSGEEGKSRISDRSFTRAEEEKGMARK